MLAEASVSYSVHRGVSTSMGWGVHPGVGVLHPWGSASEREGGSV